MPGFQTRNIEANLSGPLSKKASFFLDFERRAIDDAAVINARIVDPITFLEEPFAPGVPTSQRRTGFSPRIDYALNPNNTSMARYRYTENDLSNTGIGNFNLPERGYPRSTTTQTGQLTETAIINSKMDQRDQIADREPLRPTRTGIFFPSSASRAAFTSGGSGIGISSNWQRSYEIDNLHFDNQGHGLIKFGVRVRTTEENDFSQQNFGGMRSFSAPSVNRQRADLSRCLSHYL